VARRNADGKELVHRFLQYTSSYIQSPWLVADNQTDVVYSSVRADMMQTRLPRRQDCTMPVVAGRALGMFEVFG